MKRRDNGNFPVLAVLGRRRVVSDSYNFTSAGCGKECSERDSPESMSYLACVPCRENEKVQVIYRASTEQQVLRPGGVTADRVSMQGSEHT